MTIGPLPNSSSHNNNNKHKKSSNNMSFRSYTPPFPEPGSTIGTDGQYFCLGKLGKGTFCSIHKCVDLSYAHTNLTNNNKKKSSSKKNKRRHRLVAAKVELSTFTNSGVIEGEAMVLEHLSGTMPEEMIPRYIDYVRQSASMSGGGGGEAGGGGLLENAGGADQTGAQGISAIIMEYLPGEDMHHLRDRHCQTLTNTSNIPTRRISIKDAVYLTADVMIPLIRNMHETGVIHRDVKPSNCVRTGTTSSDTQFKMVDFGLSKSFVVPRGSGYADDRYPWDERPWQIPPNEAAKLKNNKNQLKGSLRRERPEADFRGTSMYASLRVHQSRDHCRRDDVWGLLYVFCDLVSGGLPWMSHAATRDRAMCQIIKEMVHGERAEDDFSPVDGKRKNDVKKEEFKDHIDWLLMGCDYHVSKYRREEEKRKGAYKLPSQAPPLAMSRDVGKIQSLRVAFEHVSKLGFADAPDYELVQRCLREFLTNNSNVEEEVQRLVKQENVPNIDWNFSFEGKRRKSTSSSRYKKEDEGILGSGGDGSQGPTWELLDTDDIDPLEAATLIEAEKDRRAAIDAATAAAAASAASNGNSDAADNAASSSSNMTTEAADLSRLPLPLQLRLVQVQYNARHSDTIPYHRALRDWMELAVPLVYCKWDTASYERGNHRMEDDGYRRDVYENIVKKCLDAAKPFSNFQDRRCFYHSPPNNGTSTSNGDAAKEEGEEESNGQKTKRRRIITTMRGSERRSSSPYGDGMAGASSCLIAVSRVFFGLRAALELEKERKFAPPPALSFASGMGVGPSSAMT